jgi:hypothetical protein
MSERQVAASPVVVKCIIPILNVASVAASVSYYTKVLGFQIDWLDGEPPTMASVSRDGHATCCAKATNGNRKPGCGLGSMTSRPLGLKGIVASYPIGGILT